jgi:hypothetical protein
MPNPIPETTSEWLSERASRRRGAIAEDRVQAAADDTHHHQREGRAAARRFFSIYGLHRDCFAIELSA